MYKYIFIDLDDTLWDFRSNAKASLKEVYNTLDIKRYYDDFEQFFQIYIKRNNELWKLHEDGEITREFLVVERFRYMLRQVNREDNQLAAEMNSLFMKLLPTQRGLMPYAIELLEYLRAKYPLTIISNGPTEVQHKKMNNTSLHPYFEHVVFSEDVKALKPSKQIFEHALKLNKATPDEAIMIGDNYYADITGAQNAGIDQIYFNYRGYELQEDEKSTHIVNSLEEIIHIL